jgi:hypothetical protein
MVTEEDLMPELSTFQRERLLVHLASINTLMRTWSRTPNFAFDHGLCGDYLSAAQRAMVDGFKTRYPDSVLFHRLGLLYLMKQALRCCPVNGASTEGSAAHRRIGTAMLWANDLIVPPNASSAATLLEKATAQMPAFDLFSRQEYERDLGRSLIFFNSRAIFQSARAAALRQKFEATLGVSIYDLCALALLAATPSINVPQSADPGAGILTKERFSRTGLAPATVDRFFDLVSASEASLYYRTLVAEHRPKTDFQTFQQTPILARPNGFFCLDAGFLLDKAGKGFPWMLIECLQGRQRSQVLADCGALLEEYVSFLFGRYSSGPTIVITSPRFANGDQAGDTCLVHDHALVIIEIKASTLTADAKHGGDPTELAADLLKKAVDGTGNERKGIQQLVHNLDRFLKGEDIIGGPRPVASAGVRTVYPVLVSWDRMFLAPYVRQYLTEEFRARRRVLRGATICPITIVGVSEIEAIAPVLDRYPFWRILQSFHTSDRRNPFREFAPENIPLLVRSDIPMDLASTAFERFVDDLEKRLPTE